MIIAQVLANFITKLVRSEHKISNGEKRTNWILYSYGLTTQTGGRAGITLEGIKGIIIEHLLCFDFQITNNQAKYEVPIVGLKLAKNIGV